MTDPNRCKAISKRTGNQCARTPIPGGTVCRWHGGSAPAVKAAADRRVQEATARADATRFAARTDIHPAEALVELVQYQAGIVTYWRQRIQDVPDADLEWGRTSREHGHGPEGPIDKTTEQATAHVAYRLLVEAQDKLAAYASAALKAGVDERRVRVAEQTGALVADVIRRILGDLQLTEGQQALVGEVVPRHLRALAGGEGA
ncbi:HGGxSTG domain-containing protein [Ornithinimicrobium sp. LYQ92]|uniref:HGGxSTG domain-containing protein n=1 Tax=Serinicoccus sp. LYQ92 TaxID=3378798 RepID=UPI00385242D3